MHSKQQLQKVFYLPLEYQIFLQPSSNLSTGIFPYSFHCCKRLRKFGNTNSTFITTHNNQSRGKLPQTSHSGFINQTAEFNQYSISSQKYFKSPKRMADNDVIFVESVNRNSTNDCSRKGPLYFGGNEVTITKCIQTKVLNCEDVTMLDNPSSETTKNTKLNDQEIVYVESISKNSALGKRKTPPPPVSLHQNSKRSNLVETHVPSRLSIDGIEVNSFEINKTSLAQEKNKLLMESPLHSSDSSSRCDIQCSPQGSGLSLNILHNLQFDSSTSTNSGCDFSSNTSVCSTTSNEQKLTEDSQVNEVKIMSYNILSQTLLNRHANLYHHCHDKRMLGEDFRLDNIIREILSYKCDIVCLQEVEQEILGYIVNKLSNYKYIYKKRTGGNVDGCCILYKHSKYAVVTYKFVEYFKSDHHPLLNKHNIGLIVLLKSAQHHIIVANTHLLYNPRHSDIRYEQCKMLLRSIKYLYDTSASKGTSIVITGDLNSKTNSKLVNFLLNNNNFKFKSAYDFDFVSTYHDHWTLVDYIFYSNETLKLLSHKQLPRKRDPISRIPNKSEGSDHFAIVALFSTD